MACLVILLIDMTDTCAKPVYANSIKSVVIDMSLGFFGNLNIVCRIIDVAQHFGFSGEARIIRDEISMEKGIESSWVSKITIE